MTNMMVEQKTELDRRVDLLLGFASNANSDVKRAMDRNFLKILVDSNPDLDKKYFIDFIHKAQLTGADPRLNQIYLIPHKSWNGQLQGYELKGQTIFNYMFYMQLAQSTGQLEDWGYEVVEDGYLCIITGKKKPSWKATAWVKRKGRAKVIYDCDFWEVAKLDHKTGLPQSNWKVSPKFMLKKCAIAGAFRWAFPETMGNFYIAEEMEKVVDVEISQSSMIQKKQIEKVEQIAINQGESDVYHICGDENGNVTAIREEGESQAQEEGDYNVDVSQLIEAPFRDSEDLRGELLDTLGSFKQAWFDDNLGGKIKQVIIDQITNEKNEARINEMYNFILGKINKKSDD